MGLPFEHASDQYFGFECACYQASMIRSFANAKFDSSNSRSQCHSHSSAAIYDLCYDAAVLSLNAWLDVQEFNRGLFDFLIATDDPAKQASGKAPDIAADTAIDTAAEPAGEVAAASSQLPGEQDEAGGGSDQDQGQEPDHPWAESAATVQSLKVGLWLLQCMPYVYNCSL